MNISSIAAMLGATVLIAGAAFAAPPPAGAPAGTTGLCKDGSYWSGPTKKGACQGHKGIKDWYTAASAPTNAATPKTMPTAVASASPKAPVTAAAATPMAKASAAPAMPASPVTTPKPAPAAPATTAAKTIAAPTATPAVSAGAAAAGQVWVNGKVYHCQDSKWYGKTKTGSYMTEQAAIAAGAHADHGKVCH